MKHFKQDVVYADNNATTPVDPKVKQAMLPFLGDNFANPSSLHSLGLQAEKAVEEAREQVAKLIEADPEEIVFTSCGSEANNLAIKGLAEKRKRKDEGSHLITSKIEHKSILTAFEQLKQRGFDVDYLDVDEKGHVDVDQLESKLNGDTILVSLMHANNEIGTIQPLRQVASLLDEREQKRGQKIYLHTDAVQTVGKLPVDVQELGVDLLSFSSHKIYGPKGCGALWVRAGVENKLEPLIPGSQEHGLRGGTENVPGIVGFGKAAELANNNLKEESKRSEELADKLIDGIIDQVDDVLLNGPRQERLPGNVNFSFKYLEGESLILKLSQKGIAASTGSACTSESLEPSHVLSAIGLPDEVAHGSLRLGLGRFNTEQDVEKILETLPPIVNELRDMSAVSEQDY